MNKCISSLGKSLTEFRIDSNELEHFQNQVIIKLMFSMFEAINSSYISKIQYNKIIVLACESRA